MAQLPNRVGVIVYAGQEHTLVAERDARVGELRAGLGELGRDLRTDGTIGVIPRVVHAHRDELVEPRFAEQVVEIRLAQAGGDAGEQARVEAVAQTAQGAVEHVLVPAALVAHSAAAFDADERSRVAKLLQSTRGFLRDELAVGENLEVTIRMLREEVEQLRMHERLAAEDAEEAVPVLARVVHRAVQSVEIDRLARCLHVHPAALAAEVARVQDAQIKKRREVNALLLALLEQHHRARAFDAKIPRDLAEAVRGDGGGDACHAAHKRLRAPFSLLAGGTDAFPNQSEKKLQCVYARSPKFPRVRHFASGARQGWLHRQKSVEGFP